MTTIDVLYMGTPDFAVPALEVLHKRDDIRVVGVITQPDKKQGRGYKLTPPPVKETALSLGYTVYQPDSLKEDSFYALLEELRPQLIVVAAYGKILPARVIHFPALGCVNIHASLLPKYRGAAPIQWCLINGETETGVTIMQMDEGLDTGDMLHTVAYKIEEDDTAGILFDKLAEIGGTALNEALDIMQAGKLIPKKQAGHLSCYAPMISKSMCGVDFTKCAKELACFVKGLNPFPGAKAYKSDGKMLKILFATAVDGTTDQAPGTVISCKNKLYVAAGEGTILEILKLQPEGSKPMDAVAFLAGRGFIEGDRLFKEP